MNPRCVQCGAELTGPLLGGVCPRCLARGTFGPATSGPDFFAGHELIREIGRGGAGVVYLARHVGLDRLVALKVLATSNTMGATGEERMLREAREAARLRHPHIVSIHEVGRSDGRLFYSMDFIDGEDLSSHAQRARLDPRAAARLLLKAARAIQHAHEQGVLHRDLKPANLIVDARGEPYVIDFGLARPIDGSDGLTRTGEVMGSPGYIAPEQLRGESSSATDIYGLGGVFYFLLTGRPPFVAARLPELLAEVMVGDPLPPRRLNPSLPLDLETIALRALAHDPARRYISAAALAADLENWLAGRPIRARPVSSFERSWRWARRNKRLSLMAGALTLAVALGTAGVFFEWRRAEAAAISRAAHLYSADLKLSSDALLTGDLGTARHTLLGCPPELRDAAWGLLWAEASGDAEATIGQVEWTVTDLAVSPAGDQVAAAAQVDEVTLWDLARHQLIARLPGTATSWWVTFSPDGKFLYTADRTVKQWDLATRKVIREFPGKSGALSPDGRILYTCRGHRFVYEGEVGQTTAWQTGDGAKLFDFADDSRLLALSHDGHTLATSDEESSIVLHDAHDGHVLKAPLKLQDRLWHLTFSPDDRLLAGSGWSREVRIWNLNSPETAPRPLVHPFNTWSTAFSSDGKTLAVGCSDRLVHIWDTRTWKETRTLRGHEHEVWAVAWEHDGKLLSGGRDPRILLWDPAVRPTGTTLHHDPHSFRIAWLSGGRLATVWETVPNGGAAEIATVNSSAPGREFPGEIPLAFDSAAQRLWLWAYRGELLARAGDDFHEVARWPWTLGPGATLVGAPRPEPVAGLVWAELSDGSLDVRRLADGVVVGRHEKIFPGLPTFAAALSPDGKWFVWGGHSTELHILNLATGRRAELDGHRYEVAAIVFNPDGRTFFTGGTDGLVLSWQTEEPHRLQNLGRHLTSVGQMAFSPDGRVLATHEGGAGIHLWHPATGREVGFLPVPDDGAGEWLGFSPEADRLAMRLGDGRILVFPVAPSPDRSAH